MPANLTPDYLAAEARFRAAERDEDKIVALEEMYATIPKHKGTEKLRADIKRRLSKLREKAKQSGGPANRADDFRIAKEGTGQILLLGPPNSGKSTILNRLAGVADGCSLAARKPMPAMMEYEDLLTQLVDAPPISRDCPEQDVANMVRNAEAAAVVLDCSDDSLLDQFEEIRECMSNSRTVLLGEHSPERDYPMGTAAIRTLIVANKVDLPGSEDNLALLIDLYGAEFVICGVSASTGENLDKLRVRFFESLGIIRVYASQSGNMPYILKKGSTLIDFAAEVHKDFVRSLRYARAWGKHKLDGTQIARDHVLEDGDVVELHT